MEQSSYVPFDQMTETQRQCYEHSLLADETRGATRSRLERADWILFGLILIAQVMVITILIVTAH